MTVRQVSILIDEKMFFIPHDGWSRSVPTLNRLADRLVEHGDIKRAAAECGIGFDHAYNLRGKLRKLGVGI